MDSAEHRITTATTALVSQWAAKPSADFYLLFLDYVEHNGLTEYEKEETYRRLALELGL